jgi:uncharacterized protein (TIGR02444 family)
VTESGDFWRWSLAVYDRPGMKDALLDLQDKHRCSVNLLLFALWASERHAALTPLQWRSAIAIVEDWSGAVTEMLRAARCAIDPQSERLGDLRAKILAAELDAERHEQMALERFAAGALSPPGDEPARRRARRNLAGYAVAIEAARSPGFSVLLLERVVDLALGAEPQEPNTPL